MNILPIINLNRKQSSQLHRLIWKKTSLGLKNKRLSIKQQKSLRVGSLILEFKEKSISLKRGTFFHTTRSWPLLAGLSQKDSQLPPRYFSKGKDEENKIKNPQPIPYLLVETRESSKAHLVPGSSLFLRSLCKGRGTLHQNQKGFIYLDIEDRFILSLIPYLKVLGLIKPPYFNLFTPPEGAHVPVISAHEAAFYNSSNLAETGKEFSFEIEGLYSMEPTLWPEVEQVWFFKLHSPELEAFRKSRFLLPRPGGHSFHIAVAIKPHSNAKPLPLMRVNISYLAA